MIVFGGFNLSGYVSSSLAVLELSKQEVVKEEIKQGPNGEK